ncbi:hypothetical protein AMECASPLE_028090 [Ameca splendens]|uniref:Uncharacterized protein n=1 Tax=Ameca splendens TaxID=208324 RepID=A0ABV0YSG3_9TELE
MLPPILACDDPCHIQDRRGSQPLGETEGKSSSGPALMTTAPPSWTTPSCPNVLASSNMSMAPMQLAVLKPPSGPAAIDPGGQRLPNHQAAPPRTAGPATPLGAERCS